MKRIILLAAFVALSACSTAPKTVEEVEVTYSPHSNKVILVETHNVPANLKYKRIDDISLTAIWASSFHRVKKMMADQAREAGADAVINVITYSSRNGLLFRANSCAEGTAVHIEDKTQPEWINIIGERY